MSINSSTGLTRREYMNSIIELVYKIEKSGIHNLKRDLRPEDTVTNKTDKYFGLVSNYDANIYTLVPTSEDCEEFLKEHLNMFIVSLDRKFNPNENDWSGNIVLEVIKFGVKDGEDLKTFETPFSDLRRAMVYLISELV